MCECKSNIERKLNERFVDKYPSAKNHAVTLTGYAILIGEDGLKQKGCMEFEMKAEHTLKNGREKLKIFKQNMFFNFCPFCGERDSA